MKHDWMEVCLSYGNGHEMFHIAQDNLTKEDISNALEEILGEKGWAMDGYLDEKGACFSTTKENILSLTKQLSKHFPNATVFGQDCWDYEGYIECFENGVPSRNYKAQYETFKENQDNPDYYEVELNVTAENGYQFGAGGGMIHKENLSLFEEFIANGELDTEYNAYQIPEF